MSALPALKWTALVLIVVLLATVGTARDWWSRAIFCSFYVLTCNDGPFLEEDPSKLKALSRHAHVCVDRAKIRS